MNYKIWDGQSNIIAKKKASSFIDWQEDSWSDSDEDIIGQTTIKNYFFLIKKRKPRAVFPARGIFANILDVLVTQNRGNLTRFLKTFVFFNNLHIRIFLQGFSNGHFHG